MEKFNEDEIQRKIEEKRKRFIENAHRALGFYDKNILSHGDEHKKRTEMMEKEFNKVYDDQGQPLRRYDDEPAKPLILAASKNPENVVSSPKEEKSNKQIMESTDMTGDKTLPTGYKGDDSLAAAEKEQELRKKSGLDNSLSTSQFSQKVAQTPEIRSQKSIDKNLEEEK